MTSEPATRATARYELPTDPGSAEVAAARLWAAGAHGVWERPTGLVAWFDAPTDAVPPGGSWAVEPDHDWQAAWKATIRPVHAGRFAVVPTWLAQDHRPAPDELTLVLDPGRAFGTGHHATTVLCLELLDELAAHRHDGTALEGLEVADIGCGTGVLAIAAARLGARVTAVDIDPDAVEVTGDNAALNGVVLDAAVGSVEALERRVDVVVANLVTDVVADLAEALVTGARRNLIVSGITVERQHVALEPLVAAGLVVETTRARDGWVAVSGHRDDAGRPAGRAVEVAPDPPDPRG
ncbi:50S ribosomal protein L11 methyltransferase [Egicoccus sp. AB-alg6-2]|uniref:50S ribosomal protein L11 methyltransferase n=1 Tax=Egicoccus sp. AB-alg6-2 TaxID=3242692 RepID=UPI00359E8FEB